MAYNNGIITAQVELSDIQQALGDGSDSVNDLCRSANINMWAKFKPVITRGNVLSDINDTTEQLNGTVWNLNVQSPWWRDTQYGEGGIIVNCTYGIKSQRGGNLDSLFANNYNDSQNGYTPESPRDWEYAKPNGGSLAPYRQIDFLLYDHNASSPLGSISAPSSLILTTGDAWSIDVAMMKNQDDDLPIAQRDYVTPEDILTELWGSCYFGFALIDKTTNRAKIWVTGNRYYGVGNNGNNRLEAGHSYYIMPFYSNNQLPQDESLHNLNPGPATIPGGTLFATVPNIQLPSMVIPNGSVTTDDARFSVRGKLQNGRLEVTAVVNAQDLSVTGGTVHFNGGQYRQVVIYVCQAGTVPQLGTINPNDIIVSRSFYSYNSPLDVQSGQSKTIGGSTQVFTGITVEKCRIYVYAGNGHLSDTGMTARCSGDAMVSEGTIEPTAIII